MTEEWENTSKLIRANAEALESRALDRLTSLMTERRKTRKTYQEDHTKISAQFAQVSSDKDKLNFHLFHFLCRNMICRNMK